MIIETVQTVPLVNWEDGSIRIKGSRVPLETVLYHFNSGASAEEIVYMFEGLRLSDIYAVIAYYLSHKKKEVDTYLKKVEAKVEERMQALAVNEEYQRTRREFRERIMSRWALLQQERASYRD